MPKILCFLYCLCLLIGPTVAQNERQLTPQQLVSDFELVQLALNEAHPGLYRFGDKSDIQRWASMITTSLNKSTDLGTFYTKVLPYIASIKDAHVKWLLPETYRDSLRQNEFPLTLAFHSNTSFVTAVHDDRYKNLLGTELLSINNKSIKEISKSWKGYITTEGDSKAAYPVYLSEGFPLLYSLLEKNKEFYTIEYIENKRRKQMVINAAPLKKKIDNSNLSFADFKYLNDSTALLQINYFFNSGNHSFKEFTDSVFAVLKHKATPHLIIDLRNNEGGDESLGGHLYSYLTNKSFIYYDTIKVARKERFSFADKASLPPQYDELRQLITEKNGQFYWTLEPLLQEKEPSLNAFKGKYYVLINAKTYSVSTEVAAKIYNDRKAVFIGEETGGVYAGNNSGVFAKIVLPNSGIELGIPLLSYYMHVSGTKELHRGIIPDFPVKFSIEDIINKRDIALQMALKLIQNQKN